jgi:hypothetical protein
MTLRSPPAAILGRRLVEPAAALHKTGRWVVADIVVISAGRRRFCE